MISNHIVSIKNTNNYVFLIDYRCLNLPNVKNDIKKSF